MAGTGGGGKARRRAHLREDGIVRYSRHHRCVAQDWVQPAVLHGHAPECAAKLHRPKRDGAAKGREDGQDPGSREARGQPKRGWAATLAGEWWHWHWGWGRKMARRKGGRSEQGFSCSKRSASWGAALTGECGGISWGSAHLWLVFMPVSVIALGQDLQQRVLYPLGKQ